MVNVSRMFLTIALLTWLFQPGHTIIAYDCGAPAMNITTLSLLSIRGCDIPIHRPVVTTTKIQLLQLIKLSSVKVRQCKIEIRRTIKYCGMNSYNSEVKNGNIEYIQDISPEQCAKIHENRAYQVYNTLFDNLVMNSSNSRPVVIAGSVDFEGNCHGGSYSDPYGNWNNVLVTGQLFINLYEYEAKVNVDLNEVVLRSGTRCKHTSGTCIDWEGGYTQWSPIPTDTCGFGKYEVLFQGKAEKIKDSRDGVNGEEIFSITSEDITFALAARGFIMACGYKLIKTEHPKLFIVEPNGNDYFPSQKLSVVNMDPFAYINAKFVYVARHFSHQITSLYNNIIKQECEIEKRVLRNTLGFASLAPDEFAYQFMNEPGYIAHVAGEVVRLAKCVPVEVVLRSTKECYQEFAISRGNESLFMMPRSRIITKTGHQVECNSFLSPMFYIEGNWYQNIPQLVGAVAPEEISTKTKSTWKFITPAFLAKSGIYSTDDLESLRTSIMFPIERDAVLSTIARGATGQKAVDQGITINHWLNDKVIQESVERVWGRMHTFFNRVGSFSATMLGIWVILKTIKFAIDTLVHGYALHSIFGWSIWLIGSIWDSVTNLLLHLHKKSESTNEAVKNEEIPLQTVNPKSLSNTEDGQVQNSYPKCPCPPPRGEETIAPLWQPRSHPVTSEKKESV